MWRGPATYFSMNTLPSPKAFCASLMARSSPSFSSLSVFTMRMPLPPPPAAALIRIGKPIVFATFIASCSPFTAPSVPGTSGTPNFFTASLAASLSPITFMACDEGPMKVTPACSSASAKSPFSLRKP